MDAWTADPGMHVYHFGHYEPSALKRLMGRYATREEEIDELLRAGRFVDLYHGRPAGHPRRSRELLDQEARAVSTASRVMYR